MGDERKMNGKWEDVMTRGRGELTMGRVMMEKEERYEQDAS